MLLSTLRGQCVSMLNSLQKVAQIQFQSFPRRSGKVILDGKVQLQLRGCFFFFKSLSAMQFSINTYCFMPYVKIPRFAPRHISQQFLFRHLKSISHRFFSCQNVSQSNLSLAASFKITNSFINDCNSEGEMSTLKLEQITKLNHQHC